MRNVKWTKLHGRLKSLVGDSVDSDDVPDEHDLTGKALFRPLLPERALIPDVGATPEDDVSYIFGEFEVEIIDGQISHHGNSHVWLIVGAAGIDGPIQWSIRFSEMRDTAGNTFSLRPMVVEPAPGVVSWSRLQPVVGSEAVGVSRGESAYEIAARAGFEGTEAQWLQSLKHPTAQLATPWVAQSTGSEVTGSVRIRRAGDVVTLQMDDVSVSKARGILSVPVGYRPRAATYQTVAGGGGNKLFAIEALPSGSVIYRGQLVPLSDSWDKVQFSGTISWRTDDAMPENAKPESDISGAFAAAVTAGLENQPVQSTSVTGSSNHSLHLRKIGRIVFAYLAAAANNEVWEIPAEYRPQESLRYEQIIDLGGSPAANALAKVERTKVTAERLRGSGWGTVMWFT